MIGPEGPRRKRASFVQRAGLAYRRLLQLSALPACYAQVRAFKDCPRPSAGLTADLLRLFFSYRTFPDHYGPCRLWEVPRRDWAYYFGSNYHPHQRLRLLLGVQEPAYRAIFDDKLVCALYGKGLGLRVPHTFGLVRPGEDPAGRIRSWLEGWPGDTLIIKPLRGRAGMGIVLARRTGGEIIIQTPERALPLDRFILEGPAVVQSYVVQHPRTAAFAPASVNTIRIVTLLTPKDEVLIVNASFRTGARRSFVDNFSAGGVSVGVDCATGRLRRVGYDARWNRYEKHPESGIVFEGYQLPGWDRIPAFAAAVQRGFHYYRLIGLDAAIEPDGEPVLIEVNGAPDLVGLEQKCGPLLRDPAVLRTFGEYGLLVNRHQRALLARARSRGPKG